MQFISKTSFNGAAERLFTLGGISGVLWEPAGAGPRPLILLGHGGGQHKKAPGLLARARRFTSRWLRGGGHRRARARRPPASRGAAADDRSHPGPGRARRAARPDVPRLQHHHGGLGHSGMAGHPGRAAAPGPHQPRRPGGLLGGVDGRRDRGAAGRGRTADHRGGAGPGPQRRPDRGGGQHHHPGRIPGPVGRRDGAARFGARAVRCARLRRRSRCTPTRAGTWTCRASRWTARRAFVSPGTW